MKRIYLLATAFAFTVGGAMAQKNVNLQILNGDIGSTKATKHPIASNEKILYDGDGNSSYWFTWRAKNLGPDTLRNGDELIFKTGYGGTITFAWGASSNPLEKDSSIGIIPVAQGTSTETSIKLQPNSNITESKTSTGVNWCDSVWSKSGGIINNDADLSNNDTCRPVTITFWLTGINTVTTYQDGFITYPNPTHGQLNMKFDFKSGAQNVGVVLRDLIGKTVYSRSFGNMSGELIHTVDVSKLPAGMYTAELSYNGEKLVSKVSIK